MMDERQTVLFQMENNIFGIPVSSVQEIIRTPAITSIPNSPEFFKGVISVRDKVIPVLALAKKLGLRENDNAKSRTIIVNVSANTAGIIVDAVNDVIKIAENNIDTGVNLCDMASKFISGIARFDRRLIILLDMEILLASDDVFNFEEISEVIEEYYR